MAMSGGVDYSVAAYLLHHQTKDISSPHILEGLHMNNWNSSDEGTSTFCFQSEQDANDAEEVCDMLRMKLHRVSFAAEYWTGVFEPFLEGIHDGRVMNPDSEYKNMLCTSNESD